MKVKSIPKCNIRNDGKIRQEFKYFKRKMIYMKLQNLIESSVNILSWSRKRHFKTEMFFAKLMSFKNAKISKLSKKLGCPHFIYYRFRIFALFSVAFSFR